MAVVIRRLKEHDEVENFDCGDAPLNNYLKRHAWTNQQKISIGVTYVAIDEDAIARHACHRQGKVAGKVVEYLPRGRAARIVRTSRNILCGPAAAAPSMGTKPYRAYQLTRSR